MTDRLPFNLREAARLTKAGRLGEATAALQRLIPTPGVTPPVIEGAAEAAAHFAEGGAGSSIRNAFRDLLNQGGFQRPHQASGASTPVPPGARFLAATFTNQAGTRPYKLYIPSTYRSAQSTPLLVMLHGCTQSPDDFAAGTRMNELAEIHACLVLYPAQTNAANAQRCWNWFNTADQHRDGGEPALIAGLTRQIMHEYAIDPRRIYIAGLSAGGAAAAIMGNAYPDLYAAIGIHSGLPCGAASDMQSAFAAMHGGGKPRPTGASRHRTNTVPVIVFHGDRDTTVNPINAEAIVAQSTQSAPTRRTDHGQVPSGHAYTRTLHTDSDGRALVEQWVIHNAGHAWSGGSPAGSFTDPNGPDASREMLRFFLDHPHPAP